MTEVVLSRRQSRGYQPNDIGEDGFLSWRVALARQPRNLASRVASISDDFLEEMFNNEHKLKMAALWNSDFRLVHEIDPRHQPGVLVERSPRKQAELFWPIDTASLVLGAYDDDGNEATSIIRTWTASPKEYRGKIPIMYPKMLNISSGYIPNGKFDDYGRKLYALVNDTWKNIHVQVKQTCSMSSSGGWKSKALFEYDERPQHTANVIMLHFGLRLTERYYWHVAIGRLPNGQGPRVLIPTSASACLSLLRDRDAPEGRNRREALKHWVSAHYRDTGSDNLSYVCQHLRANTKFTWHGFHCELLVSEYDYEKNEFFHEQSAAWRVSRKHNQLKTWKAA